MMRVTFYAHSKSAADPIGRDVRWEDLARDLQRFRPLEGVKVDGPAWSPVELARPHRLSANVAVVTALVLDFDDGRPIDDAWQEWEGHDRVLYTTRSHGAGCPKYRIALPLARPVPGRWWSGLYRSILTGAGKTADRSCVDPARIFYLPIVGEGGPHETRREAGEWLDLYDTAEALWDEEAARAEEVAREARARIEELKRRVNSRGDRDAVAARLMAIDPDTRLALGQRVGAQHMPGEGGGIVRRAPCPACGRRDVWWAVSKGYARCNHANSCGWTGPLHEYARGV